MSLVRRVTDAITGHSKLVIVVSLVLFAVIGAGAVSVDQDSSLQQFETDSQEAAAMSFIDENMTSAEAENRTTVQVIVRGDNVLSKESLLRSLEFQRAIRDDDSINATLAGEDPVVGVGNLIATVGIIQEEADEIAAEVDEIERRGDLLEERGDRLEERGQGLQSRGASLQEDAAALEAERAALENRTATLSDGLNETRDLQVQYLEARQAGANESELAAINASIQDAIATATAAADLDAEEAGRYALAAEQVRLGVISGALGEAFDGTQTPVLRDGLATIVALQHDLETAPNESVANETEQAIQDEINETVAAAGLQGPEVVVFETLVGEARAIGGTAPELVPIETAYETGTAGVFREEFADLEEAGQRLEERQAAIEREGTMLESDAARIERQADRLEERGDELEERGDELEDIDPSLAEQIAQLESMSEAELQEAIEDGLGEGAEDGGLAMMSTDYQPGTTTAGGRMILVTQEGQGGDQLEGIDTALIDTQLELRDLAEDRDTGGDEYVVFGAGIMFEEIDQSMGDSLAIVGPLALVFVVVALAIAYRDLFDIVLGVFGILLVLLVTFGFMGWADIAFNQIFVAVPVLLIGLSIDYAIHVFMRHREQRRADNGADGVGASMSYALAGVGIALVWVTATTAFGFLANAISPIQPIREFGIISAVGILAALAVFGVFVPAAKVELDRLLERVGLDRRKRAFGTGGGGVSRLLAGGATAARRAPLVVLLLTALVTAGGVYGATQVDTTFQQEDFLADAPPAWTETLPEPFAPSEYRAKQDLELVNENFQRQDSQANLLIRGDVTDPALLAALEDREDEFADSHVAYLDASGDPDVRGPVEAMDATAADNESFNESFVAADTDGDGIPDRNLESLYDAFFAADETAASEVLHRTDGGGYDAAQVVLSIDGNVPLGETTAEMRRLAAALETDDWSVTATGTPIVNYVVEQELFDTVFQSLALALVSVFVFLTAAYWLTGRGATLGAVTLLPVALTVAWILGSMYLIGMPFNVLTGMITSLTIGLGVAYCIHISSRYMLELERTGNVWAAMEQTVTGTGGALLGSAATTVGGFGTLALAILPALQQFGIITGLTIVYAFLASVVVLPTLLVIWTRYLGPDGVSFAIERREGGPPAAADGGAEE